MDVFVERLKSDIEKMKNKKLELKPSDYLTDDDDDEDDSMEDDSVIRPIDADAFADLYVSEAADCLLNTFPSDAHAIHAIALLESTARRLFPFVSQPQQLNPRSCGVDIKYLEEVKAAAATASNGNLSCIIKPDALLQHLIIRYLQDANVGEAAELQWDALLRKHMEGGKFRNCFAVCDMDRFMGAGMELPASLGLFVSEMNEEAAWKGKLISCAPLSAAAGDDHAMLPRFPHLYSVFDLILQVTVNENLKPDQMIQKLFIFNHDIHPDFYDDAAWETRTPPM
ncbi:hypothetical protein ACFX12_020135 [Malus domestica]